jgi:hypothetical protein
MIKLANLVNSECSTRKHFTKSPKSTEMVNLVNLVKLKLPMPVLNSSDANCDVAPPPTPSPVHRLVRSGPR